MTTTLDTTPYEILPFKMDKGTMHRAAIGLIVLSSDQTMEYEWRRIIDLPGVAFFESRIPSPPDITPESLMEMHKEIAHATELLLPGVEFQVMAFGCTSGAIVIGEDRVFEQIRTIHPGVPMRIRTRTRRGGVAPLPATFRMRSPAASGSCWSRASSSPADHAG